MLYRLAGGGPAHPDKPQRHVMPHACQHVASVQCSASMCHKVSAMLILQGLQVQHRKLSKEELEAMAERLSRVEKTEKKEPKVHPMQLKYEFDSKSRKYTERYIRAKKAGLCRLMLAGTQTAYKHARHTDTTLSRETDGVGTCGTRWTYTVAICLLRLLACIQDWGRRVLCLQVSSDAQTEYLKALAERCVTKQQQTEEALRRKYLKPLNPNAKKLRKADMEEHLAKVQRLYQGQGVVDKP